MYSQLIFSFSLDDDFAAFHDFAYANGAARVNVGYDITNPAPGPDSIMPIERLVDILLYTAISHRARRSASQPGYLGGHGLLTSHHC